MVQNPDFVYSEASGVIGPSRDGTSTDTNRDVSITGRVRVSVETYIHRINDFDLLFVRLVFTQNTFITL